MKEEFKQEQLNDIEERKKAERKWSRKQFGDMENLLWKRKEKEIMKMNMSEEEKKKSLEEAKGLLRGANFDIPVSVVEEDIKNAIYLFEKAGLDDKKIEKEIQEFSTYHEKIMNYEKARKALKVLEKWEKEKNDLKDFEEWKKERKKDLNEAMKRERIRDGEASVITVDLAFLFC